MRRDSGGGCNIVQSADRRVLTETAPTGKQPTLTRIRTRLLVTRNPRRAGPYRPLVWPPRARHMIRKDALSSMLLTMTKPEGAASLANRRPLTTERRHYREACFWSQVSMLVEPTGCWHSEVLHTGVDTASTMSANANLVPAPPIGLPSSSRMDCKPRNSWSGTFAATRSAVIPRT